MYAALVTEHVKQIYEPVYRKHATSTHSNEHVYQSMNMYSKHMRIQFSALVYKLIDTHIANGACKQMNESV